MAAAPPTRHPDERYNLVNLVPFILMHLAPLLAFWTGASWHDWLVCVGLYYVRMFFITGGYHRYFAHRTYKTSRWFQFVLAFGGATAAQKGALWWAAHHRHHHKYSDQPEDIHSPKRGFWWSHMLWILVDRYEPTDYGSIKDLAKYPELVWLNKHFLVAPSLLGLATLFIGGWSTFLIGFVLSTVVLWHGTFTINSLSHVFGSRRYETTDTSRNSLTLALLTLGEGWHNNHHHYQSSTNNGFYWWEIDITYYALVVLSWLRVTRDLRRPPQRVLDEGRNRPSAESATPTQRPDLGRRDGRGPTASSAA